MAYRPQINLRERGAAIAAVVAIHAALLLAILNLAGKIDLDTTQSALRVIDIRQLLPKRPQPVPRQPRAKSKAGGSAPKSMAKATPIVAPKPRIETPPVQRIAVSETPAEGTAPTQGTVAERGSASGTGGTGSGIGSGTGSGRGAGADNGVVEPPRLATAVLGGRDFPRDLTRQWPRRATVFLRLRIDAQGTVAECMVDRGTGVAAIDNAMCNLAHERLRFHPALNSSGQAVAGWFGYAQPAPR